MKMTHELGSFQKQRRRRKTQEHHRLPVFTENRSKAQRQRNCCRLIGCRTSYNWLKLRSWLYSLGLLSPVHKPCPSQWPLNKSYLTYVNQGGIFLPVIAGTFETCFKLSSCIKQKQKATRDTKSKIARRQIMCILGLAYCVAEYLFTSCEDVSLWLV